MLKPWTTNSWLRIAFKGNERYTVLPFDAVYFLEGGKSSNVVQLLRLLYKLRKQLHEYNCSTNILLDGIFLSRVLLFSIYFKFVSINDVMWFFLKKDK